MAWSALASLTPTGGLLAVVGLFAAATPHVRRLATLVGAGLVLQAPWVVAAVTATPARMLAFPETLGTLQAGAVADVTVLDLVDQDVEFVDTLRHTRTGRRRLVTTATFKSGRAV